MPIFIYAESKGSHSRCLTDRKLERSRGNAQRSIPERSQIANPSSHVRDALALRNFAEDDALKNVGLAGVVAVLARQF